MFSQSPYECRVEWGQRGAREAAERGDIIIIVDVLSFSSTVVTAVNYGAVIYPYPKSLKGSEKAYAEKVGAELILGRAEASRIGKLLFLLVKLMLIKNMYYVHLTEHYVHGLHQKYLLFSLDLF